tara:strand:- start:36 stop:236 length:201 start_codon:yes stop_codon:yes gene_type:complete
MALSDIVSNINNAIRSLEEYKKTAPQDIENTIDKTISLLKTLRSQYTEYLTTQTKLGDYDGQASER